jgi:dolichyl-phosphate-mannose--protein O-mannosyl transferase
MTIAFEYEFNYLGMRMTNTLLGALTLSVIFNRKIGGKLSGYNV